MADSDKVHTSIPLCFPDNFEWDRGSGTLVKKRQARGKLVVCEDALEILRSIDGPICPIAVTGPARCGKSYIASQMVEPRPHDFVWISTDVFKKKLRRGVEVTVVVMDTEGLGAYDAYSKDDLQMFSLMSLLASVLVYNSRGSMTGHDIKKLSWVGTLGNVINVDQTQTGKKSTTQVLKLGEETGDDDDRVKESNSYRKVLLKSFPVFDAFKLSTPSIDSMS
ncbi:guanylate-binding protein 4-like [Ptychodera flava]|uniref:guanylate-binding protein 4-like n=1 Tax=Ptychodera flava TaxID=63121 RepID=UPI00396A5968